MKTSAFKLWLHRNKVCEKFCNRLFQFLLEKIDEEVAEVSLAEDVEGDAICFGHSTETHADSNASYDGVHFCKQFAESCRVKAKFEEEAIVPRFEEH